MVSLRARRAHRYGAHCLLCLRIVPNYELAPDLQTVEILRVVVRENMSEEVSRSFSLRKTSLTITLFFLPMHQLIDRLVCDIIETTENLVKTDSPMHALSTLGTHSSSARRHQGKLDHGSGQGDSGTYAKQC